MIYMKKKIIELVKVHEKELTNDDLMDISFFCETIAMDRNCQKCDSCVQDLEYLGPEECKKLCPGGF